MHIVDTTIFHTNESGGVRRYLNAKHTWLTRYSRCRHTLLVPGPYTRRYARANDTMAAGGVVHLPAPRIPFTNGYRWPLGMRRWEEQLIALQPDVIEAGDPYRLAWLAQRIGWEHHIPVVGFYHSDLPRMVGMRFGRRAAGLTAQYVGELYRHFDLVLAPSCVMVERLHDLGVSQAQLQPLGVDTHRFSPALPAEMLPPAVLGESAGVVSATEAQVDDAWTQRQHQGRVLRQRLDLSPATRLLIYAGRFAREKNLPVLCRAMERLGPGYHLLLVGSGMNLPRSRLITCLPFQSSTAELARLLAGCDAFVHPGHRETFGLAVLEAMACGLPVVGTSEGGVAELIDSQVGRQARPCDEADLAAAITDLFTDDLSLLSRRARERALHYDWHHVLANLMDRYASLAHQPHAELLAPATVPHALD